MDAHGFDGQSQKSIKLKPGLGALAYVVVEQDDGTTQYGYINQQGEWVYSWTE